MQCIKKEGERSESLLSILYLTVMLDAHNFQSSKGRVFYCKGNLAVLRQITQTSKGESKENTLRKPCQDAGKHIHRNSVRRDCTVVCLKAI